MERASSLEQRDVLTDAGTSFHVVEDGVRGSSMLADARTGEDMSAARAKVIEWLNGLGADGAPID